MLVIRDPSPFALTWRVPLLLDPTTARSDQEAER